MRGLPIEELKNKKFSTRSIALSVTGVVILLVLLFSNFINYVKIFFTPIDSSLCPSFDIVRPKGFYKDNSTVEMIFHDEGFRNISVAKLAGAVQVDTQIGDNQPNVPDAPELWAKFKKFHAYLEKTFPTVYDSLEVDFVNTYGLVFYWKGSDPSLKPLLLMAHQDTVPIQSDTLDLWSYPPLSGHYDGKFVYGRGASDCKNVLIAIMETFELLLSQDYKPKRGIIASFGFDEEASGVIGAHYLSLYLEEKFGKDSMYAIIDEGPGLLYGLEKEIIAMPGTGEKGYIDILAQLTTPGGHSSIPPDHTSIGIMSELAQAIEADPYSPILTEKNPILGFAQCSAINSKSMSSMKKKAILRAGYDKFANSMVVKALRSNILTKYLVGTSQAIDIIKGGEKANALPETTKMTVNHRVAIESNCDETKDHFVSRVLKIAKKYDLGVKAFDEQILKATANGEFVISSRADLEPAPVTPKFDKVWEYLSGTTRHIFEDYVFTNLTYPIVMTPGIMTGNTDTKHYWNLTKNIFRYSPFFVENILKTTHVHSVDERIMFDGHLQILAFFYEYVQAIDTKDASN